MPVFCAHSIKGLQKRQKLYTWSGARDRTSLWPGGACNLHQPSEAAAQHLHIVSLQWQCLDPPGPLPSSAPRGSPATLQQPHCCLPHLLCSYNRQFMAPPWLDNCLSFARSFCALVQPLQTVPAKHDSFMPKVQMLVLLCGAAAAVLAMHHATKADCRRCEQTHKQRGHLAAPQEVAISLRAATMLLLFPSRALTACTSPSSLAMPCKVD